MSQGRAPVPEVTAQIQLTHVAQVGLPQREPGVVGHPHPQDLIVLPGDDLLGDDALLAAIPPLPYATGYLGDIGVPA